MPPKTGLQSSGDVKKGKKDDPKKAAEPGKANLSRTSRRERGRETCD
jgi:hypothetical protein